MKNIMDAIADDQILNQVLIGWVHDVATGLKFANWNND